jgi:hypothetical protein
LIKDIIKFRVNFNKDHTGSLSVAFKNIKWDVMSTKK